MNWANTTARWDEKHSVWEFGAPDVRGLTVYWYPSCDHFFTHWGRVKHICVSELTIIGSDNGLSPGRRQAIIWNNAGLLLIEPLGTNVSEILIESHTFSFKKMHFNMSSAKWRPFCLGLNVLIAPWPDQRGMLAQDPLLRLLFWYHVSHGKTRLQWVKLMAARSSNE